MSLTDARHTYRPFEYEWMYTAFKEQNAMHWTADEVSFHRDIADWSKRLTDKEKHLLTQVFRFFTAGDIGVAGGYLHNYIPIFAHKPEAAMMLSAFANMESIHIDAYSKLIDTLGLPEVEYSAFLDYKSMADKYEYIQKFNNSSVRDIAKSLAVYSAFTEGLQLFSSFIILLSFPRRGLLNAMGSIITWSIRDECYSDDTEILTESGWKLFQDLGPKERVASVDDNHCVQFIKPSKHTKNYVEEPLFHFHNAKGNIDQLVTKNHRIIYTDDRGFNESLAGDFTPHYRKRFPGAGLHVGGRNTLSIEERILIALQADGHIPVGEYRNGNHCGYRRVSISLKRQRKVARLTSLLDQSEFEYDIRPPDSRGRVMFYINIPMEYTPSKKFKDWINIKEISFKWGMDFLDELMYWDGHDVYKDKSVVYYSCVDPDNVDVVQAIAALSGRITSRSVQKDGRKDTYSDVHRLWVYKQNSRPTGAVVKDVIDYKGNVYCVTVPSGKIITRRNGCVAVTGNCLHVDSMLRLFNEYIKEHPRIWTDEFKKELYDICRTMVDLEEKFLDTVFELGGIEGLTKEEVMQYVKYIADRRLLQLGLKPNYGVKDNPLPWVEDMLNSTSRTNFFENSATEYSKAGAQGSWSQIKI